MDLKDKPAPKGAGAATQAGRTAPLATALPNPLTDTKTALGNLRNRGREITTELEALRTASADPEERKNLETLQGIMIQFTDKASWMIEMPPELVEALLLLNKAEGLAIELSEYLQKQEGCKEAPSHINWVLVMLRGEIGRVKDGAPPINAALLESYERLWYVRLDFPNHRLPFQISEKCHEPLLKTFAMLIEKQVGVTPFIPSYGTAIVNLGQDVVCVGEAENRFLVGEVCAVTKPGFRDMKSGDIVRRAQVIAGRR